MIEVTFAYYRVRDSRSSSKSLKKRGKPDELDLFRYSRKSSRFMGLVWGYLAARGGKTICYISYRQTDDDGQTRDDILSTGEALCSMSDNFRYEKGRGLAFRRALLACPKEYMAEAYVKRYEESLDFAQYMVNKLLEEKEESDRSK